MVGLLGFAGECVWFTSCGLVLCLFAGFGNVLRAACPLQLGCFAGWLWLVVGLFVVGWWCLGLFVVLLAGCSW